MNQGQVQDQVQFKSGTTLGVDPRIGPSGDPRTGQRRRLLALLLRKDLVLVQLADRGTRLPHTKEGIGPHARTPDGKRQFLVLFLMQDPVLVRLEDPDAGPGCWSWKRGQLVEAGTGPGANLSQVQVLGLIQWSTRCRAGSWSCSGIRLGPKV